MPTTTRTPNESAVTDFEASLAGRVIAPDHEEYDAARSLWNGAIDRRPALIVRVASPADVVAALEFAREEALPLAVRGGGHHVTGSAVVDDGLVIDTTEMAGVTIDPATRTARVGPGARVGDVIEPAAAHGLTPVGGSAAQTGIAGSSLAGGIGWLRRAHGLGIDHLRSIELVTVDGETLTASERHHPDLFWALRGGGPNVGIVTEFEFELVEVGPEVMVAQVVYPIETAADVLERFRRWARSAPRSATSLVVLLHVPPLPMVPPEAHGAPVVMVYSVYAGSPEAGEGALAPLRTLGEPLMDLSGPMPLAAVHDVARDLFPDARHYSWHSLYADRLDDETIDAVLDAFGDVPTQESDLGIWHMGGAIADVADDATAFGFRSPEFMLTVEAATDDPADYDDCVDWARRHWTALRPLGIEGFYPGFPGFVDGEERARMAYGDNYERLAAIKADYDPDNLLRNNLNVEPA